MMRIVEKKEGKENFLLETEQNLWNETFEYDNKYYCSSSKIGDKLEVKEIKLNFENKESYEDALVCPVCGYECDSSEIDDDDDHYVCGECGSILNFRVIITKSFDIDVVSLPDIVKVQKV